MALIMGLALGGPRDGKRISGEKSWDGRVIKSVGRTGTVAYYAGHYALQSIMDPVTKEWTELWVWIDELH